jgi:hypothetical protein
MQHERPLLLRLAALALLAGLGVVPSSCMVDLGGLTGGGGMAGAGGTTSGTTTTGTTASTSTAATTASTTTTSSSTSSTSSTSTSSTSTTSTTGDGAAPVTPADLYALTQTCQQYPNSTDFASYPGGPKNVPVCTLNGSGTFKGAVWWSSGMLIACDGGSGTPCKNSSGYSSQTAGLTSTGGYLDASTLPFVVVPASSNGFDYATAGIGFGSVVAVLYKNQLVYAIVGDEGGTGVIGEGSYALAGALNIPNNPPATGGIGSGVTYIVFTGPLAMVSKNEDPSAPGAIGPGLAQALVAAN